MSTENQNRIDVSFDNGSANNGIANITIIETKNGTTSSTPIEIPIGGSTNLDYNAGVLTNESGGVTNLGRIQRYMMLRTICDIRKDAINATIAVDNSRGQLDVILTQIFENQPLVEEATLPKLEEIKAISYHNCKEYISGRVFIKSAYTDHIPIPVQYVFNESGAKPDTFSPEGATIMSSFASVADPATRTNPTESFPGLNFGLRFDRSFMELVGFLEGTMWGAMQIGKFDVNNTQYNFRNWVGRGVEVSGQSVTDSSIATTPFNGRTGYYFQGNPTKNKFINKYPDNVVPEILKYMIIKEMGDMMQVYVMLVWFCLEQQKNQMNKHNFVMSTTDLVVMNTCQLFQMPCLYTNQGKDNSMLTEQDKKNLEDIYKKKILAKANGIDVYKNWKKNNKFANTLYYLPITENGLDKLKRRLNTIYYVIKSQNDKQLAIFEMASENTDKLRYIKMGRLGPLMTSFSNPDIIKIIIDIITANIENINHNLLVKYTELYNNLNDNPIDQPEIELKNHFSLNILITRQIYPPNSHSYVYVIQNVTRYTKEQPICDDTTIYYKNNDGKLVNMILDTISDNNIEKFKDILEKTGNVTPPNLDNIISTNPKVSDPGPNENWLIYSIANWFNVVHQSLIMHFGDVFKPFDLGNLDILNMGYWEGVGGKNHEYHDTKNEDNSLQQPYINIGFVTMIPSIYEHLCSIYEKHDVVYDDDFGKYFIVVFILNLTRYYQGPVDNENPTGKPMLTPPYNNIGPLDGSNPFSTSCRRPYKKNVIHTDDIEFDLENIRNSDIDFKEELKEEIHKNIAERIGKNVFTVNDHFARVLIIVSGLTFNDNDNDNREVSPLFSELFGQEIYAAEEIGVSDDETSGTSDRAEGHAELVNVPSTPIHSQEYLETLLSPQNTFFNKLNFFNSIISPLKDKQILGYLKDIRYDNIYAYSNQLYDTLNDIRNGKIPVNDENLEQIITKFVDTGKISTGSVVFEGVNGEGMTREDDNVSGGKIIKNKKTRRRMGRTRHKKHHKTNKKHKKHQTSCKNKTRKSKKAKRKNKTR